MTGDEGEGARRTAATDAGCVEDLDLSEPLEALVGRIADDLPRHGAALVRLVSGPPGTWVGFDALLAGDIVLCGMMRDIQERYGVRLVAAWLPAPGPDGAERVIATVFSPEWNGIAGTLLFDRKDLVAAHN